MTELRVAPLGEIAEIVMGTSPPGSTYNHAGEGDPLLNGPTEFGPRHPTATLFTTAGRKFAERGDLLFCVRGSTTGRMNWADRRYAIGRGTAAIRAASRAEAIFVGAAIEWALPGVLAGATGSTMPNLNADAIDRIPVPVVEDPRRIGEVLGAVDDLIENNRRRVEVLEEMARAIYREWFVHFRFPGHEDATFVDSALGPIPEGWELQTASEALEIKPRLRVDRDVAHPFITMGDVSEDRLWCSPSQYKTGSSGAKFQNWDTLFARITPCLENGKTALVLTLEGDAVGRGSTEFIVLRGREVGPVSTYCLARSDDFRAHAIASMSGASGRQRVRDECFDAYLLAIPPREISVEFEARTVPMVEMIKELSEASVRLAGIRDLLLPKLVTGQIDVSDLDLDAVVERAGV